MAERYTPASLDAVRTGQKISMAVKQSGCSVRELQEMLGLSCPQPIYRWFRGRALPSIDHLYMLSRILGGGANGRTARAERQRQILRIGMPRMVQAIKKYPRKAAGPSAGISIITVTLYILTVWSREIHPSLLSW